MKKLRKPNLFLRAFLFPATALSAGVIIYFLVPKPTPGAQGCQYLAHSCANHQHEHEPSSTNSEGRLNCPCDELVSHGCLRAPASLGSPSRVEQVCAHVSLPPLRLTLHDERRNTGLIQTLPFSHNPFASHLKQFYNRKEVPTDGAALLAEANGVNRQFLKDSSLKEVSLKYSSAAARLANPDAYLADFLKAAREVSPKLKAGLDAFLNFKHALVKQNVIRVAEKAELKELAGRYSTKDSGDGKTAIREITLSTESSASLPNQFSTLFHELVHADNFEPHLQLDPGSRAFAEAELLDEAKAYEAQMGFYLEMARANPDFFCNWLHVTNRYGNLIVPLGWMMAAVERELISGQFMASEAARINFKEKDYLFDKEGGVKPALRARMQSLGYEYAR